MRLKKEEIASIKQSMNQFIGENCYALYLFGSRVDERKRGGDIDLLLVVKTSSSVSKDNVLSIKHEILAEIKCMIGDQKIDLVVADENETNKDPFIISIKNKAVKL